MLKTHLYIALIAISLITCSLSTISASPRLTVVVVVDGLRQDNLDMLRPYWQQGGLRTLSEEAYQTTIDFPHLVYGGNETTATLMTGLTPDRHGYAMDTYFSRSDRHIHPLLEDTKQRGIGTDLTLSPAALYAPTMADMLRMQQGEKAKIYAIGLSPATTILMAGHSANACCWLDSDKQAWVTTAYYPQGLPSVADDMNIGERMQQLLDRPWTPRLNITSYTRPTDKEIRKSFAYDNRQDLLHMPVANTLVIELALALQKAEQLGADYVPDMLLLHLNTITPTATADRIQSAEQEDMHLCLNQDLGYLIEQLQKRLGKQNVDFLVVGRPILGIGQQTFSTAHIDIQPFNIDRAAALVSTYLMALYGHERWVDGGYGNAIFLNRTLIEQKRISLATIQRQVANFLMDFEAIQTAFPQNEALLQPDLAASLNKKQTGDVVFTLLPAYQLFANAQTPLDLVLEPNPIAPLLFYSGSLQQFPTTPLSATDLIRTFFKF